MKWGQSRRALKAVLRTLAFPLREMGASWCCELETGRDDFAVQWKALSQARRDIPEQRKPNSCLYRVYRRVLLLYLSYLS